MSNTDIFLTSLLGGFILGALWWNWFKPIFCKMKNEQKEWQENAQKDSNNLEEIVNLLKNIKK